MDNKSTTAQLSTDRLEYLHDQFAALDNAQPMSYALELRVLRDDIITAIDMAWQAARDREAANAR